MSTAQAAWRLAGLIQRAFYVEGRNVTLPPELVELAETAGVPRIEFADRFDSQAARDATVADFRVVAQSRHCGIPYLAG
jgi:putative protein-disulfide isomerase